jgi:hypothetical protein
MGEVHQPRSGCPVNAALEVSGDRWSLLVRRDIAFADRRYFRELQAGSAEGSPQIFSPTDSSDSSSWLVGKPTRAGDAQEQGKEAFSGCGRTGWRGRMRGIGIAVPAWDAIVLASDPGLACAGGLVVVVRGCWGRGRWW